MEKPLVSARDWRLALLRLTKLFYYIDTKQLGDPFDDLWLCIIFLTKLTGYRSKNTGTAWVFVLTDDYSRIFVKSNVSAIITAKTFCRTNYNSLYNVALLNCTAWCSLFYRSNDNITDVGIPPFGASKNTDAHNFFSACVVGYLEVTLLLYHSGFLPLTT